MKQRQALYEGIRTTLHYIYCGAAYEVQILSVQQTSSISCLSFEDTLVRMYGNLLDFLASALIFQRKTSIGRSFHALREPENILSFKERCLEIGSFLEADARILDSALIRTVDERSRQVLEASRLLESMVSDTKTLVEALQQEVQDQHRMNEMEQLDALEWISSVPYGNHHDTVKQLRSSETCKWLLQHRRFREWEDASSSAVLWLQGSRTYGLVGSKYDYITMNYIADLRSWCRQNLYYLKNRGSRRRAHYGIPG